MSRRSLFSLGRCATILGAAAVFALPGCDLEPVGDIVIDEADTSGAEGYSESPADPADPSAGDGAIAGAPSGPDSDGIPLLQLRKTKESDAEVFSASVGSRGFRTGRSDERPLRPSNTHICFLTKVSGDLSDMSSDILLNILDGKWHLSVIQHARNSLSAEATCVPWSSFIVDPGGVKQVSGEGRAWRRCSGSETANMWQNASAYITGVAGDFEGSREKIEIINTARPNQKEQLRVATNDCSGVNARARSLRIGDLDKPGNLNHAVWRLNLNAGSDKKRRRRLARTRDAVCFLEKVSGDFDGGGERIRIFAEEDSAGREWWVAEAKAKGGSAYGGFSCIKYDQREINVVIK